MRDDIKTIVTEKADQLLLDILGAASICVTFVVALYLPGLF